MKLRALRRIYDSIRRWPTAGTSSPYIPMVSTIYCPECGTPQDIWTKALFADCVCGQRIIILPYDEDVEWIESTVESAHISSTHEEAWLRSLVESAHGIERTDAGSLRSR